MSLVRLIYTSRVSTGFSAAEVKKILTASTRHNPPLGLTGLLCCDGRHFLQCLEGSRQAVNDRYARILSDSRHHDVVLLGYGEIVARQFGAWAMGYVALSSSEETAAQHDVMLRLDAAAMPADDVKPHAVSLPMARAPFLKYSATPSFDPYGLSEAGALGLLGELGTLLATGHL